MGAGEWHSPDPSKQIVVFNTGTSTFDGRRRSTTCAVAGTGLALTSTVVPYRNYYLGISCFENSSSLPLQPKPRPSTRGTLQPGTSFPKGVVFPEDDSDDGDDDGGQRVAYIFI